ncbi:MAG: TadE family protein, partial [Planctomycetota bacterium]|nr:TadE family protein [Planctomycetota bacterium]
MKLRGLCVVRSDDGVRCTPSDRRGGVAVEFALIAFALYLILAGMLSFGRWMAIQQAAQDVARFAAREVALYPLPAETDSLDAALADSGFRAAVYDPDYLVVNLDALAVGQTLDDVFAAMPVVNRALRPLMIFSSVDTPDGLLRLLPVPGAIVSSDVLPGPTGLAAPTG